MSRAVANDIAEIDPVNHGTRSRGPRRARAPRVARVAARPVGRGVLKGELRQVLDEREVGDAVAHVPPHGGRGRRPGGGIEVSDDRVERVLLGREVGQQPGVVGRRHTIRLVWSPQ